MIEKKKYSSHFFDELKATSLKSAKAVLPFVKKVINPHSVIDIGCGTGEWLKVWKEELGVLQVKGVEGPYIDPAFFAMSTEYLATHDLKEPYFEDKKYDLAMSLEVGEHLPEDKAHVLVQTLTRMSDVVLFSAAIPGQAGTYHINLQYPEYWADLFYKEGFETVDIIRREIWNLPEVEYWYKQNMLIFIRKEKLGDFPSLKRNSEDVDKLYLTRIHPELLELKNKHIKETNTLLGYMNWKWVVFKYKYLKRKAMKNA
jgi:SAM-dependent methyltransferase